MKVPEWAYGVPPVSVIGESYCTPYPLELIVKKNINKLSSSQFQVFDLSGNFLLKVDGGVWNFKLKRVLLDPAGFPILTLRGKALAFRHKWKAHAGESTHDTSNILFSVKQSHPLQIKKQINIFLANNFKKKEPDFHITGAYTSLSFKVYEGRRLIAEVKHNFTLESFCKGKEKYKVKVYPEVDYAFIVALLVILDENDTQGRSKKKKLEGSREGHFLSLQYVTFIKYLQGRGISLRGQGPCQPPPPSATDDTP